MRLMPWWNESPTVMPEDVRERVARLLGERTQVSAIKRELRELGLHEEADGRANSNGDRVYRAIARLRDELEADGELLADGDAADSSILHQNEIGRILSDYVPRDQWLSLAQIYDVVAEHASLSDADEGPEAAGSSSPRW